MPPPITTLRRAVALILASGCTLAGCSHAGGGRASTAEPSASSPHRPPSSRTTTTLCQDLRAAGGRLPDPRDAGSYGARLWRRLAADAPTEIRPDAQRVATFVADLANGSPGAAGLDRVRNALSRVSDWAATNCI